MFCPECWQREFGGEKQEGPPEWAFPSCSACLPEPCDLPPRAAVALGPCRTSIRSSSYFLHVLSGHPQLDRKLNDESFVTLSRFDPSALIV